MSHFVTPLIVLIGGKIHFLTKVKQFNRFSHRFFPFAVTAKLDEWLKGMILDCLVIILF